MQNMQNISQLFSRRKTKKLHKISESDSSINSRTCLGHLVLFFRQTQRQVKFANLAHLIGPIFVCFGGAGGRWIGKCLPFFRSFIGDLPFNISKAEMSLLRRAVGVKLGFQEFPNYKVSQRFSLNLKVSLTIEFYWERLYVNISL